MSFEWEARRQRGVCPNRNANIFGGKKVWRNRKEKVDKLAVGILSIYETYFTVRLYTHTLSPRAPHTNTHRP